MAEFRQDVTTGRWVIIAENRSQRPEAFRVEKARQIVTPCPFCAGREEETPPASATYPPRADPWTVRVVPNKYPAVEALSTGTPCPIDAERRARAAAGAHEVIIESPRHVVSLSELNDDEVRWTFTAYRDRMASWYGDSRIGYVMIFKNARSGGGASLEHAHSQLVATTDVPPSVQTEVHLSGAHWQREGECLFCRLLNDELAAGERLVLATDRLVAFCPFAARFPYETWIAPRMHFARYDQVSDDVIFELSLMVRRLVSRVEARWPGIAYNFWIHTAPAGEGAESPFHWHLELVPRLTRLAGFELGGGYFINPVLPERAAAELRDR